MADRPESDTAGLPVDRSLIISTGMRIVGQWLQTVALILAVAVPSGAEEIVVVAASSMSYPILEIVERFERETGHTILLTRGSSGNFYGQITNGAPFDVFLSADREYPAELQRAGLVEPGSLEIYAVGRIVLWVGADSVLRNEISGMESLMDSRVRRIAIANSRLAPYGAAAVAAMQHYGVYDQVASKIVQGDNIAQAAQFVSSGAADVGVLALSMARSEAMDDGSYWEIPDEAHRPIEQAMVILSRARDAEHYAAARAFRDMVRGPVGRTILERYGFSVP